MTTIKKEAETKSMGGVTVVEITEKKERTLLCRNTKPAVSRQHLYSRGHYKRPYCFPHLYIRINPELVRTEKIEWLSHYAVSYKARMAVCILTLTDGSYWHAPNHRIGECPFIDYAQQ